MREVIAFIFFRPWLQAVEILLNHDPQPSSFTRRLRVFDSHLIGIPPGFSQQRRKIDKDFSVFEARRDLHGMLTSLKGVSQQIHSRGGEMDRLTDFLPGKQP